MWWRIDFPSTSVCWIACNVFFVPFFRTDATDPRELHIVPRAGRWSVVNSFSFLKGVRCSRLCVQEPFFCTFQWLSIDELLKQVNAEGAHGFRYKTVLSNDTSTLFVYVRDELRPSAKYPF